MAQAITHRENAFDYVEDGFRHVYDPKTNLLTVTPTDDELTRHREFQISKDEDGGWAAFSAAMNFGPEIFTQSDIDEAFREGRRAGLDEAQCAMSKLS